MPLIITPDGLCSPLRGLFHQNWSFPSYPLSPLFKVSQSAIIVATFKVRHQTCQIRLFYTFYPVCLANSSESLNPYEISCINYLNLASLDRLDSLASQALDDFRLISEQALRFKVMVEVESTTLCLNNRCSTN